MNYNSNNLYIKKKFYKYENDNNSMAYIKIEKRWW